MSESQSFTGRRRGRKTSSLVRVVDVLTKGVITVGGIGTIVAVLLVCFYLVWVTLPLFMGSDVASREAFKPAWTAASPRRVAIDEYRTMGWALAGDGMLSVFRADNGELLEQRPLFEGAKLTAASFAAGSESDAAFGFEDGTVRLGRVGFNTRFLEAEDVPAKLRGLKNGKAAEFEGGMLQRVSAAQFRLRAIDVVLEEPIPAVSDAAVLLIDHTSGSSGNRFCTYTADGKLRINSARQRKNLMTDEVTYQVSRGELPYPESIKKRPSFLRLSGLGDNVFLAWDDGQLVRYDTRSLKDPQLTESLDLTPDSKAKLTCLEFLLGRSTLITGDSAGNVRAWFRTRPEDAETSDRTTLVAAHDLPRGTSAVTALASSARSRVVAAGYASGQVGLFYVTGARQLAELDAKGEGAVTALAMAPKDDGLISFSPAGVSRWDVNLKHPEATFASLFLPVWYEGYERPAHVWQSSGGTDDFEMKLGMAPLVFGTLKATFYSMMFGVPLALLAAIYTSEFLHPRVKAKIKPTIELMASLPSVVLGFLAALVIAPIVEDIVPAVLASFFTVPLAFLGGAYLWQLLPRPLTLGAGPWRLLFILFLALPLGLTLAWFSGPVMERLLFAGDIKAWLDGQAGSSIGGWVLLLLPLSSVGAFLLSREVNSWLRATSADWSRERLALFDLVKFFCGVIVAVALATIVALLLDSLRLDPRGVFMGGYSQRNALIVGFMMGFAIIPLIYTIADDALSSVPNHLRSASLGAGATPWQTATRIVVPTAMSGLFSAVMIGLGRAVGETMVMLMAAGNTPIMDMNIFNGFRTLAANIATEMPEAVKDSTHYRTLFLAALTLFAITFAVNTVAEKVRLRFRRRAYEL